MSQALEKQDREALLLDFAEQAMAALIPTFGDQVEAKRNVIAHKSFMLASATVDAYERREWARQP